MNDDDIIMLIKQGH